MDDDRNSAVAAVAVATGDMPEPTDTPKEPPSIAATQSPPPVSPPSAVPRRGPPVLARCEKGHVLMRGDVKVKESDPDRPPCQRCANGDAPRAPRNRAAVAVPIPGIDSDTEEQKAAKAKLAAEAARAAAMATAEMNAARNRAILQAGDAIRALIGDEAAGAIGLLAKKRGRQDPKKIPARIIRLGPVVGQPFTVAMGNVELALAVGLSDGLVTAAPSLPFLEHPALPSLLTIAFALLAIVRAPTQVEIDNAGMRVHTKHEEQSIKVSTENGPEIQ